jgi:glycerol transport system substrate-binding protein
MLTRPGRRRGEKDVKLKLSAIAVAAMLVSGSSWADMKAAEKWVKEEFQPSTLSQKKQLEEMKWFIDAANEKLEKDKLNKIDMLVRK